MSDIQVPVSKFLRVIDYLDRVGLDSSEVARRASLNPDRLKALPRDQSLSLVHYTRLYREAAREMKALKVPLPWAAGIGSDSFELMCYCIITAKSLRAALQRAEKFDHLLFDLNGYGIRVSEDGDCARLNYRFEGTSASARLVPEDWDRAQYQETVSNASGLLIWHAFCGWLIGRSIELDEVRIAAPYLNEAYEERLKATLHCPVRFDSENNELLFPAEYLDFRLVHTADSLPEFLDNAIYQLIIEGSRPASTSAAIKTLVRIDFSNGIPSFAQMAEYLHMSESSLRRRLLKEGTNYQALKDEIRCDIAIENLRDQDMKIADLADYLGFTEPSSFVRSFRNWTGMTPKAYRDRMTALGN